MAYTKRTWEDRAVEHPRRYEKFEDAEGKLTLIPEPGEVYKAGTPLNAANMNAIEQGIEDAHETADAALPKTGGEMANTNLVVNLNADQLDGKEASDFAGKDHVHGAISKDGKVGTVGDRVLMTGIGGSVEAKTPVYFASFIGMSNENLLHNWDWRNPVNQRGVSGVISSSGYNIDRWYLKQGQIELRSDGIRVGHPTTQTHYYQIIERPQQFAGKTVTISARVKDVTGTAVKNIRLRADGNWLATSPNIISEGLTAATALVPEGITNLEFWFFVYPDAYMTVESVKMETSEYSTLYANTPPMDHAVELPKCMRFCQVFSRNMIFQGYASSATVVRACYAMPVRLRISPTHNISHCAAFHPGGQSANIPITDGSAGYTHINFLFTSPSAVFTPYQPAAVQIYPSVGDMVVLSADL